jgi:NAD(P)-dependent dehydrogenase (short-subunit alcohol dehydrogenase family)
MSEQRVAVVTGASSGIGAAIASSLAADGFRVFGACRRAPADIAVEYVAIDVTDDDSVRQGVASILAETGRIDVLVNNAGYLLPGAIEEVSLEEAKAQFDTGCATP